MELELDSMIKAPIKTSQFINRKRGKHMSFQIPEKAGSNQQPRLLTLTYVQIQNVLGLTMTKFARQGSLSRHLVARQQVQSLSLSYMITLMESSKNVLVRNLPVLISLILGTLLGFVLYLVMFGGLLSYLLAELMMKIF